MTFDVSKKSIHFILLYLFSTYYIASKIILQKDSKLEKIETKSILVFFYICSLHII